MHVPVPPPPRPALRAGLAGGVATARHGVVSSLARTEPQGSVSRGLDAGLIRVVGVAARRCRRERGVALAAAVAHGIRVGGALTEVANGDEVVGELQAATGII